jgi:hypothetical protein
VRHNHDIFPYYLGHAKKVFPHLDCRDKLKLMRDKTKNFPCDRVCGTTTTYSPYYLGHAKKVFSHLDCLDELKLMRDRTINFPCARLCGIITTFSPTTWTTPRRFSPTWTAWTSLSSSEISNEFFL